MKTTFREIFKPNSGARAFFTSIIIWGVGVGCFAAAMNNYLSDICRMNVRNKKWLKAVELIKAAAEESARMDYLRVIDGGAAIVLDLHACARAERNEAAARRRQEKEGGEG